MDLSPIPVTPSTNSSWWDDLAAPSGGQGVLEVLPVVTDGLDDGWFGKIALTAVLVFGLFGNCMVVVVLRRVTHTGWSALSVYLTSLAFSDTVMLCSTALPMWTRKVMNFDLYVIQAGACKGFIWVMNTSASVSAWILVALTAQRALSVVWPHRVNLLCTRRTSVVLMLAIAVLVAAVYAHTLYGYEIVQLEDGTSLRCSFRSEAYQEFWVNVWVNTDLFVYCLCPVASIIVSNAVLGWKLSASLKEADMTFSSTGAQQKRDRKKRASATTVTVIIVSMAFVLATLPLMIYNLFFHDVASKDPRSRRFHFFLYDVFFIFSLSNFAWNFYLYCLTGTKFRREFLDCLFLWFGCCKSSTSQTVATNDGRPSGGVGTTNEGRLSGGVGTLENSTSKMESNDDF